VQVFVLRRLIQQQRPVPHAQPVLGLLASLAGCFRWWLSSDDPLCY